MKKSPIIIVMVSDNEYAQHTAVAIASILVNAAADDIIKIHIISDNMSGRNKSRIAAVAGLNKNAEICFNEIDSSLFKNAYVRGRFPVNVYWRLYLAQMFPGYRRMLYLDSDTITLASLRGLFDTDMGNNFRLKIS